MNTLIRNVYSVVVPILNVLELRREDMQTLQRPRACWEDEVCVSGEGHRALAQ